MSLSEFLLICAGSRTVIEPSSMYFRISYRPIGIADRDERCSHDDNINFNEVETNYLCTVTYSSISNKERSPIL
jgi:hypothetical protein